MKKRSVSETGFTSIQVSRSTRARLEYLKNEGDTYEIVIKKLLEEVEK